MAAIGSASMMPKGLRSYLPEPTVPWHVSTTLLERVKQQSWEAEEMKYKKCQVLLGDPDCRFILEYFNHQRPTNYGISKIFYVHTPHLMDGFETSVENIDQKAKTFKPEWVKEGFAMAREKTIQRWKAQVEEFSPIAIKKENKRIDIYTDVKVLPVWQGTSKSNIHSICSTGFTYFGKHHFFNPKDARPGTFKNTDKGYFGSGAYFTNSAKYAAKYACFGSGDLFLAWVAMREPFPIINDVPHPSKGKDMTFLEGHSTYQAYDAHYIPVAPLNNTDSCMEYYPCYGDQAPECDEIVITQEMHALPHFVIELGVEFPTQITPHSPIPEAFVVDLSSFYVTLSPGLAVAAKCSSNTCSQKDQTQWVSLGRGSFTIEKIDCTTLCPCCKTKFKTIDHYLLQNTAWSLEGLLKRTQPTNNEIKIKNPSLPAGQGMMINRSQSTDWQYLEINFS
jgi:hypothetical protein